MKAWIKLHIYNTKALFKMLRNDTGTFFGFFRFDIVDDMVRVHFRNCFSSLYNNMKFNPSPNLHNQTTMAPLTMLQKRTYAYMQIFFLLPTQVI